jgi:hypothetical protein
MSGTRADQDISYIEPHGHWDQRFFNYTFIICLLSLSESPIIWLRLIVLQWIIIEKINGKKLQWSNLNHYPESYLEGLMKTPIYESQSKGSLNSLTSTVWCTISSYHLYQSVACHFHVQVLQRLRDAVRGNGEISGREEVSAHTSLVVQEFLVEENIPVSTQPLYSCSLLWKWAFRGHFRNHWGHKSNATAELQKIPKEAFRRCFQQW